MEKKKDSTDSKKWKWGLILSLSLAVLLAITGLIISGLEYLDLIEPAKLLNKIGTVLMLFAAPLYFLAAHCLDKIDLRKKSNKTNSPNKSL